MHDKFKFVTLAANWNKSWSTKTALKFNTKMKAIQKKKEEKWWKHIISTTTKTKTEKSQFKILINILV